MLQSALEAYGAMAEHAGIDLQTALEKRYTACRSEVAQADPNTEVMTPRP